jgi:hypothetical protein
MGLLPVHRRFWWVGVLIGVVGVPHDQFLVARLAVSQNTLGAITLPLGSALGASADKTETMPFIVHYLLLLAFGDPLYGLLPCVYKETIAPPVGKRIVRAT